MDSILNSTKKILGISPDDDSFDVDLIIHINTGFIILNQLGVGPTNVFSIGDAKSTWDDFVQDIPMAKMVESYIPLKVKTIFDPPTSSAVSECLNRMVGELEWRLQTEFELKNNKEEIQNG